MREGYRRENEAKREVELLIDQWIVNREQRGSGWMG